MTSPLTKHQWIGAAILIAIIVVFIGSFYLIDCLFQPVELPPVEIDSLTMQQIMVLEESASQIQYKHIKKDTIPLYLHQFDPNSADSIELLQLGFKPWMVRNMLRYRAKNGVWRTKESLKRVYGMTDELYLQIEPYINIVLPEKDSLQLADSARNFQIKKDTILNLNLCDTTELKYIRGIGSGYARRIVNYRNRLGGYVSTAQLYEIDGLPYTTVDSVITHFIVDSVGITVINVNHSSVERLQRHPYISFTQAKAIYTLRRNRFHLNSIEELAELDCLSETDITRLRPYLSFTTNAEHR